MKTLSQKDSQGQVFDQEFPKINYKKMFSDVYKLTHS